MTHPSPPTLPPPGSPRHDAEYWWDLPHDKRAPGRARELTVKTLAGWGMDGLAESATVIVSELVTNALLHGTPPISLALHRHGLLLRGEVTDHGPTLPTMPDIALDDLNAEHGRGLPIVAAYADRWGIDPAPTGKTVWFILSARPAEPGPR